jgi:hypothetical protein
MRCPTSSCAHQAEWEPQVPRRKPQSKHQHERAHQTGASAATTRQQPETQHQHQRKYRHQAQRHHSRPCVQDQAQKAGVAGAAAKPHTTGRRHGQTIHQRDASGDCPPGSVGPRVHHGPQSCRAHGMDPARCKPAQGPTHHSHEVVRCNRLDGMNDRTDRTARVRAQHTGRWTRGRGWGNGRRGDDSDAASSLRKAGSATAK